MQLLDSCIAVNSICLATDHNAVQVHSAQDSTGSWCKAGVLGNVLFCLNLPKVLSCPWQLILALLLM